MLKSSVLLGLALVLLASCTTTQVDPEYELTTLILPTGHPEAGREAFMSLGCGTCHSVAWEPELPEPVSHKRGPELGPSMGNLSNGSVLTAIVAPSHFVPRDIRFASEDKSSPMGDFTETMTVRELVDLVAYLRTQGGTTVASLNEVHGDRYLPPWP